MTSKILFFGSRSAGRTMLSRYNYNLEKQIKHQKKVIDRLSRKIQRIKKASLSLSEINKILYCIELVVSEHGNDYQLSRIYYRLYDYRKGIIENEKKKFYR